MNTDSGNERATPLAEVVAAHRFVNDMAPRHLAKLLDAGMFKLFERGELVFREGEPANRFYLICHGKIIVEAVSATGTAAPIQTLMAGDVLGWSWLFPPYSWHFSARAVEPTRAVFFYGTRLRRFCDDDPEFGCEIMKRVAGIVIHRLQVTRLQLLQAPAQAQTRSPVL